MLARYAMNMKMTTRTLMTVVTGATILFTAVSPDLFARGPQHDQDTAREEMLEGHLMPFTVLKRRTDRAMGEATYYGVSRPQNGIYRIQYLRPDGQVIWVYVDGKTGEIVGRTR